MKTIQLRPIVLLLAISQSAWVQCAAARCEEHDRQQLEQQQVQEQAPTLVFAPINRLAQFLLQQPLSEPVGTLADTFAKAGRDEPDSMPSLVFNWRPLPVASVWFRWQQLPPAPIEAG